MAGSYNHVVDKNGNLGTNEQVVAMLENGGDVFEGVEEMYGMIWFLAHQSVAAHIPPDALASLQFFREAMKDVVETARQSYVTGLHIAKEVNKK